jgi:ATP-dependent Clp protease ATP-binding subunit ClpC
MAENHLPPEVRIENAAKLSVLGKDLTGLAFEGKLAPIYKRKNLVDKVKTALEIRQNPLLVGKSGTGKNAIVESLVIEMVRESGEADINLYANEKPPYPVRKVIECQPMSFQVDCFYCHELENKIKKVVENCQAENATLFIDNLHLAINAGALSDNPDRTIANLLKPYLEKKELIVIGATTPEGYNLMHSNNPSFVNLFQKIEVPETSLEETKNILSTLKSNFESVYSVTIDDDFLSGVVEIAHRLFPHRAFPGKALEIVREVIAQEKTRNNSNLSLPILYSYIATKTGLAEFIVLPEKKLTKEEIINFFQSRIFEQEEVIKEIAATILKFKAGLNPVDRPIDVMLFLGPSGVGKTELAKTLAEYLFGSRNRLIRFDMSEYKGAIGYEKLIGSRFRAEPGLLIAAATANPFAVYLFDEIEKADSEIFDLFLQVFGEGRITDPKGQTAILTNSIIIMTSNIGSGLYKQIPIGFSTNPTEEIKNIEKEIDNELKKCFRPEFINRIKVLYFKPLSKEGVKKIARREISLLSNRFGLKDKGYRLEVSEEVIELLADVGYSSEYGARQMQRAVEKFIVNPLAEKLTSEEVSSGSILRIILSREGKIIIQ